MASPFAGVYAKHVAGGSPLYQMIGDSTFAGAYEPSTAWPLQLTNLLGARFDQTARYNQFNFGPSYAGWSTKYVGGGSGTISVRNASVNGNGLTEQTPWVTDGDVFVETPDVIFHGSVANDVIHGMSGSAYLAAYDTFIDDVKAEAPGVPIVVITQNPWYPLYETSFLTYHNLLMDHLGVDHIPLDPPVQQSTTVDDVWVADTRQALGNVYNAALMADSLHANAAGNLLIAQWVLDQIDEAGGVTTPVISTTTLGSVGRGVVFYLAIAATGDGLVWTLTDGALPAGLHLNDTEGVVYGTPTSAGAYSFTLRATNGGGYDEQAFSGTVDLNAEPFDPTGYVRLKWKHGDYYPIPMRVRVGGSFLGAVLRR